MSVKVKSKILAKIREFRAGMDLESFMLTEWRQVARALNNLIVDYKDFSNFYESSVSALFQTSSFSYVPEFTVSITTTTGNIFLGLKSGNSTSSYIEAQSLSNTASGFVYIFRNDELISVQNIRSSSTGPTTATIALPPSIIGYYDTGLEEGEYTYRVAVEPVSGNFTVNNAIFYAEERP